MKLDGIKLQQLIEKVLSSYSEYVPGASNYEIIKESECFINLLEDLSSNTLKNELYVLSSTYNDYVGELLYTELIRGGRNCNETIETINDYMANTLMIAGTWRFFILQVLINAFIWNIHLNYLDFVKEDETFYEFDKPEVQLEQAYLTVLSRVMDVNTIGIIALGENGKVFSTKKNTQIDQWEDIIQVSAGYTHFVGLKNDGTVLDTLDKIYTKIKTWRDIVSIGAGNCFTVGLRNDGRVLVADNVEGNDCCTLEWEDIIDISVEEEMIGGLDKKGKVHIKWHSKKTSDEWEPGNEQGICKVFSGGNHVIVVYKNGNVVSKKFVVKNYHLQSEVKDFKNIVSLSTNQFHTVGINVSGKLHMTPYREGSNGQKNDYGDINREGILGLLSVSTSNNFFVGLKPDGTLVGYGKIDEKVKREISGWQLFTDLKRYLEKYSREKQEN